MLAEYKRKLIEAFLKSLDEVGVYFRPDPIYLINTYHTKERNFRFFRSLSVLAEHSRFANARTK